MSYEDKLALAKTLKKKSIRLAPSDSVLLEVKKGLDDIAANDKSNTTQLVASLNALSAMLEAEKLDRVKESDESSKGLIEALKAVQEEIRGIVIPPPPEKVQIEGLEKFLNQLSVPNRESKAAPIKVVLKDDDIYSRYKRVDSATKSGVTHHGFADQNGNWFIQKEATTTNGATSRYAVGNGNFGPAWSKRSSLDYLPFYDVVIP